MCYRCLIAAVATWSDVEGQRPRRRIVRRQAKNVAFVKYSDTSSDFRRSAGLCRCCQVRRTSDLQHSNVLILRRADQSSGGVLPSVVCLSVSEASVMRRP